MRIAFAVMSVGLGHATRSLPLMKTLIERGHELTIISNSNALEFLKHELNAKRFIRLKDYSFPNTFFRDDKVSVKRFLLHLPLFFHEYRKEQRAFRQIHKKHNFQCIISDTRYGIYKKKIPSYIICHHIKNRIKRLEKLSDIMTELSMLGLFTNFDKVLIPDLKSKQISGAYANDFRFIQNEVYLGILSMMKKQKLRQDVDYFFSLSGPESQRKRLEKKVFEQLPELGDKKIVITLGSPKSKFVKKQGNLEVYGYLNAKAQADMMNRAKLVIARSGYSTIMDLVELGKKALLIPTKGLPEQEYLANYHNKHFLTKSLDRLNLRKDLAKAERFPGISVHSKTKASIKKFLRITNL